MQTIYHTVGHLHSRPNGNGRGGVRMQVGPLQDINQLLKDAVMLCISGRCTVDNVMPSELTNRDCKTMFDGCPNVHAPPIPMQWKYRPFKDRCVLSLVNIHFHPDIPSLPLLQLALDLIPPTKSGQVMTLLGHGYGRVQATFRSIDGIQLPCHKRSQRR